MADRNTHIADSLTDVSFFTIPIIYKVSNNIGKRKTNISAVIGMSDDKNSLQLIYSFKDFTIYTHHSGSCNTIGRLFILKLIKINLILR